MDRSAAWKETLPADMAGIDWDGCPRSSAEARSVIEVITAMAAVPVEKGDLRPVPLLVSLQKNVIVVFFPFYITGQVCLHCAFFCCTLRGR